MWAEDPRNEATPFDEEDSVRRLTLVAVSILGALMITAVVGGGLAALKRLNNVIRYLAMTGLAMAAFGLLFLPISFDFSETQVKLSASLWEWTRHCLAQCLSPAYRCGGDLQ